MNNKRVGGKLWGDVCREYSENFAKMCVFAWQTGSHPRATKERFANVAYEWARPT